MMNKRILLLSIIITIVASTSIFAYRWVEDGNNWKVYDESSNEYVKNNLVDTGAGVYYLNSDGVLVTGWWQHPQTKKVYFFDNNPNGNYGAMVFGHKCIDGYYRYFAGDGSLVRADKEGDYINVNTEFLVDFYGDLYFDNQLMRDVSIAKSDYYTNPIYYTNEAFNNYFLATQDSVQPLRAMLDMGTDDTGDKTHVVTASANFNSEENDIKKDSGTDTSGGTNYHIDEYGRTIIDDPVFETEPAEKYGPMAH